MPENKKVETPNLLEGGEFICYDHNFRTNNPEKWYQHCEERIDGKPTHTEDVTGPCIFCNNPFHNANLPFKRPGTPKALVCDKCRKSELGVE